MVHREYLGPDRFDLLFATKELARDMQTLSMLLTLELRRFALYPIGAADVSQFFAYSDEPGTMLVWTVADWSGNELTCKSTSAGAVQLEQYGIEAWSVIQQVVSFSSDKNESFATKMSKADRWETLDHRACPETRAKCVAEQTIQADEKVPDTIDSINNGARFTRRTKEKLPGARKALESLTQKAAIAHESNLQESQLRWLSLHSRVRENLPTRCRRDRTHLRVRRIARAILTQGSRKQRRCQDV